VLPVRVEDDAALLAESLPEVVSAPADDRSIVFVVFVYHLCPAEVPPPNQRNPDSIPIAASALTPALNVS
jgi:hypothetical protein